MTKITPKKPSTPVNTTAKGKQRAWDVILDGEVIDTVYYDSSMGESEVKRSLVNHDGYDSSIKLKSRKAAVTSKRTAAKAKAPQLAIKAKGILKDLKALDSSIEEAIENGVPVYGPTAAGVVDSIESMTKVVKGLEKNATVVTALSTDLELMINDCMNAGTDIYNSCSNLLQDDTILPDDRELQNLREAVDYAVDSLHNLEVFVGSTKTAASKRTALHAKSTPAIEEQMDKIEALLNKVEAAKDDTYIWRKWRTLRKEYKLALIPQIKEYLEKNFGVNAQDNNLPIIRNLDKLEIALENTDVGTESLAQDKERAAKGKQVIAFLDRLARVQGAPLAGIVELLNSLDLRKEANTVAEFIKNSKSISDTVQRVVVG